MSRAARRQLPELLVITGLSGSGKTHVSRALEDAGWFCVDNLPMALVPAFAELARRSPELRHTALVVDLRERGFTATFPEVYRGLKRQGRLQISLVFLEADDRTLLRRFSETRRPHPLASREPLALGIRAERTALSGVRRLADAIVDTSRFTVHELRDYIQERYDTRGDARMLVSVLSFGYKYGVPYDADLVLDCRFLPNPFFVDTLKAQDGRAPAVRRFVTEEPEGRELAARLRDLLGYLLPRYQREGKAYLTVAVGCTGGRHRSVAVIEDLRSFVEAQGVPVAVTHRDDDRES